MFTTNVYQNNKTKLQKNNLQLNLIPIVTLIRVKNNWKRMKIAAVITM